MSENTPYSPPNANVADAAMTLDEVNIFSFKGRIGRLRYIAYGFGFGLLGMLLMGSIMGVAAVSLGETAQMVAIGIVYFLGIVSMTYLAIIFAVQRLHDLDQSGWLCLLLFVPLVGAIFTLYLWFAPGTRSANRFGNPPIANSGGVIATVVLIPVSFIVLSILAAIAIPAYQGYINQAQQAQQSQLAPGE